MISSRRRFDQTETGAGALGLKESVALPLGVAGWDWASFAVARSSAADGAACGGVAEKAALPAAGWVADGGATIARGAGAGACWGAAFDSLAALPPLSLDVALP
jgi:hypothetical protein